MKNIFFFLLIFSISFMEMSCRPTVNVPKERGYFRVDFPEKSYRKFDSANYPYSFDYPVYSHIAKDTDLMANEKEPYWIDIEIPDLNATIYLTYKKFNGPEDLDRLIAESYKLTYAHDKKADYISDTTQIKSSHGLTGIVYKVGGDAASAYQFFANDDKSNFLRGALYFNASPNADSLRPAIEFLKKDMDTLIETLEFK